MDRYLRPCLAEMVGTFILCFIGAGAICVQALPGVQGGLLAVAMAHGIALAVAVTAAMGISGGHINPAVTITFWVLGKIDTQQAAYYIASQLLGALLAGAFIAMIFGGGQAAAGPFPLGTPHITDAVPYTGIMRLLTAGLIEAVGTFILVFAVFATAVDPRAPKIGGLGIGLALAGGILAIGPLTGGAMNPARYLGSALWEAGLTDFSKMRGDFAVYIAGPILGGIAAGWLYAGYILPREGDKK